MRLLLDTHVLLWALENDRRLGPTARRAIETTENEVYVSSATAWEIALKRAAGKLDAPKDLATWIGRTAFRSLAIEIEHAVASADLPNYHRDPFDRLLVAQAQLERLTLVTSDPKIAKYDVGVLDAAA